MCFPALPQAAGILASGDQPIRYQLIFLMSSAEPSLWPPAPAAGPQGSLPALGRLETARPLRPVVSTRHVPIWRRAADRPAWSWFSLAPRHAPGSHPPSAQRSRIGGSSHSSSSQWGQSLGRAGHSQPPPEQWLPGGQALVTAASFCWQLSANRAVWSRPTATPRPSCPPVWLMALAWWGDREGPRVPADSGLGERSRWEPSPLIARVAAAQALVDTSLRLGVHPGRSQALPLTVAA